MKFSKECRRLTLEEAPLIPGRMAYCFTEDENGSTFTECIEDILNTKNIAEAQVKNDLLARRYVIQVIVKSAANEEDIQDIRFGLSKLDDASKQYRLSLAKTELDVAKAQSQRIIGNIQIMSIFDSNELANEFDYCNLNISSLEKDEINKGLIFIAGLAQRPNPLTYVIPTTLANELENKEVRDTSLGKTLNSKVALGSVFAKGEGLTNNFVRAL